MTLTAGAGSGGFSVRIGDLAAGSGQVLGQQQRCAQVAAAVTGLIAQMAGTAGHQGLTDALVTASQSGMQTYAVAGGCMTTWPTGCGAAPQSMTRPSRPSPSRRKRS